MQRTLNAEQCKTDLNKHSKYLYRIYISMFIIHGVNQKLADDDDDDGRKDRKINKRNTDMNYVAVVKKKLYVFFVYIIIMADSRDCSIQ